jgi:autotransporter strand-loop-strand O-heptosyltransferase
MENIKIYGHGSYIGTTGYNHHTRDFFRGLSKYCKIKFRNFTVASNWNGYNLEPHNQEEYLDHLDKNILHYQTVWVGDNKREDRVIYPTYGENFQHDFNLILSETNHHYFYDLYSGPKIAYNVWESTLQPEGFFNKLKEFDELWVPSEWQKECSIKQGYDPNRIQVVPEGVDVDTFFPEKVDILDEYKDGRFKFLLFGRWDYRKSTKEIIETFLKTFKNDEPIDLIVSIDNLWGEQMDGHKNTIDRLKHYNLIDDRIKILSFPSREDYIKYIKTGHVFLSCARSEGWNLPLIEAMSCGTPSIYSNCSGQLEFAKGKGIPIDIIGEKPANENTYARYVMSDLDGNYYEPDFEHLSKMMRDVYENYESYKSKSLIESVDIRNNFSWSKIAEIGYEKVKSFKHKISTSNYRPPQISIENKIKISYLDGPKVEVLGDIQKEYFVEFLDESDNVIHSSTITNNMWTNCGRKYYTKWKIRINGQIVEELNLENKRVLISLHSSSMGDTLAWSPYAVEFAKKHKCKVILSTFHNEWFEGNENYKNIEFIKPGKSTICDAVYNIGWFKDENQRWEKFDYYPTSVNLIPLQQTATDILGLEFKEVNYGLNYKIQSRPIKEKYIVFGPQATSGCKEWVFEYWDQLAQTLHKMGYKIVILSQKPYLIQNTINIVNRDLNTVMNYLLYSEFLIGLGSGLSWLNWALGKHTYMINGFSEDGHEFTRNMTRITKNVCIKCWNDEVHIFDPGDWDWCPVYKGTKKQHICQKSIKPIDVLSQIKF